MKASVCLLALLSLAWPVDAENGASGQAPNYSAASFVNSANNLSATVAPNTIATLFGENLSWNTKAVAATDIRNETLPTLLVGTGVRVLLNNMPAPLYYVSPSQVNLLIPSNLLPGNLKMQVVRDGRAGPEVYLRLREAAPELFLLDAETAIVVREDGSVATGENPARPGEIVVLYGTGLGRTKPDFAPGQLPDRAAPLIRMDDFRVWLNGAAVAPERVLYAGVAPGFAGLYQINLRLPEWLDDSPQVHLSVAAMTSQTGIHLPAKAGE